MATLHCEIITPDGPAFSGEAEMVVVPGTEGELGVLPRHQPIVAHLDVGQIRVKLSASEWRAFASSDGYFSMQNNRALVLVEGAVPSDQIDVEAATTLAADARERIAAAEGGDEAVNLFRARRDLEFAENQLRLAGR
ncbi:MAG: ATP synthase F1 subunit epsilon [Gaiellales bacterium]|jgi:F-type H+-transporting ATPase subunit epsilon